MISPLAFVFLLPAIMFGSFGSVFLKKGSSKLTFSVEGIVRNYYLIFGIALFGLSMVLYIPALSLGNLSVVYPLSSLSYVVISMLSVRMLNEHMNVWKWMGIAAIVFGSFVVVQ